MIYRNTKAINQRNITKNDEVHKKITKDRCEKLEACQNLIQSMKLRKKNIEKQNIK